jgi:predicted ester cyclase
MRRLAAVTCVLFLLVACKKDEGTEKKPAEKKADKKPEEKKPEPPKALTGADLLKAYQDCQWTAVNAHDLAKVKTCWSADAKLVMAGAPEMQGEAISAHLGSFLAAFPDMKVEPLMVFMSGNTVASVVRMSGTNTGSLMGAPATGKPFALVGIAFDELDDQGKIKMGTHIMDSPTMMGQLGMMPDMKVRPLAEPAGAATTVIATDSEQERANLALVKAWGEAFG